MLYFHAFLIADPFVIKAAEAEKVCTRNFIFYMIHDSRLDESQVAIIHITKTFLRTPVAVSMKQLRNSR